MKIRLNVDVMGENVTMRAGEVHEVPAPLGKALCSEPKDEPRAEPVAQTRAKRAEKR